MPIFGKNRHLINPFLTRYASMFGNFSLVLVSRRMRYREALYLLFVTIMRLQGVLLFDCFQSDCAMFSQRSWGRKMTNNIQPQDTVHHFLEVTLGRIFTEEGIFLRHVCQHRKSDKETSLQKTPPSLFVNTPVQVLFILVNLLHVQVLFMFCSRLVHGSFRFCSCSIQVLFMFRSRLFHGFSRLVHVLFRFCSWFFTLSSSCF